MISNLLLVILNWLNPTPAKYQLVNGLDAVSYEELCNEVKMNPHKLVRELVRDIDTFRSCSLKPHVHEKGTTRPLQPSDIEDLKSGLGTK